MAGKYKTRMFSHRNVLVSVEITNISITKDIPLAFLQLCRLKGLQETSLKVGAMLVWFTQETNTAE